MGVLRLLFLFLLMFTRVTSMAVRQKDTGTVTLRDRWQAKEKVIKKDENVIFFPTACYQSSAESSDEWILPIHG